MELEKILSSTWSGMRLVSLLYRFSLQRLSPFLLQLGGTIGDIEGMPFIEAFRQFQFRVGLHNFSNIHVSLVPQVCVLPCSRSLPPGCLSLVYVGPLFCAASNENLGCNWYWIMEAQEITRKQACSYVFNTLKHMFSCILVPPMDKEHWLAMMLEFLHLKDISVRNVDCKRAF